MWQSSILSHDKRIFISPLFYLEGREVQNSRLITNLYTTSLFIDFPGHSDHWTVSGNAFGAELEMPDFWRETLANVEQTRNVPLTFWPSLGTGNELSSKKEFKPDFRLWIMYLCSQSLVWWLLWKELMRWVGTYSMTHWGKTYNMQESIWILPHYGAANIYFRLSQRRCYGIKTCRG